MQIIKIQQQQPFLIGNGEGDRQHAFLHLVQVHQPREQQRPHLADRGANGVALFAKQIPELHRGVGIGPAVIANLLGARGEHIVHLGGGRTSHGEARKIALHVRHKTRHAHRGKPLDNALYRHRLAGAGRTRDQPVAIGAFQFQRLRLAAARSDKDAGAVCHVHPHFCRIDNNCPPLIPVRTEPVEALPFFSPVDNKDSPSTSPGANRWEIARSAGALLWPDH